VLARQGGCPCAVYTHPVMNESAAGSTGGMGEMTLQGWNRPVMDERMRPDLKSFWILTL